MRMSDVKDKGRTRWRNEKGKKKKEKQKEGRDIFVATVTAIVMKVRTKKTLNSAATRVARKVAHLKPAKNPQPSQNYSFSRSDL